MLKVKGSGVDHCQPNDVVYWADSNENKIMQEFLRKIPRTCFLSTKKLILNLLYCFACSVTPYIEQKNASLIKSLNHICVNSDVGSDLVTDRQSQM